MGGRGGASVRPHKGDDAVFASKTLPIYETRKLYQESRGGTSRPKLALIHLITSSLLDGAALLPSGSQIST